MFLWRSVFQLNNTVMSSNKASRGGAVSLTHTTLNIANDIFKLNWACAGGAIYSWGSHIFLNAIKLSNNRAIRLSTNYNLSVYHNLRYSICNGSSSGKGGGILIHDTSATCSRNVCAITWTSNSIIQYTNNSAESGSVLHGGMINMCDSVSPVQTMAKLMGPLWSTTTIN